MLVSRQVKYVVLKPLRYAGRGYEPGDVFNARRADPPMGRLRKWCEMGVLGLPEEPEQEPPSDVQLVALAALAAANELNAEEPEDKPEAEEPAESEGGDESPEAESEEPAAEEA